MNRRAFHTAVVGAIAALFGTKVSRAEESQTINWRELVQISTNVSAPPAPIKRTVWLRELADGTWETLDSCKYLKVGDRIKIRNNIWPPDMIHTVDREPYPTLARVGEENFPGEYGVDIMSPPGFDPFVGQEYLSSSREIVHP